MPRTRPRCALPVVTAAQLDGVMYAQGQAGRCVAYQGSRRCSRATFLTKYLADPRPLTPGLDDAQSCHTHSLQLSMFLDRLVQLTKMLEQNKMPLAQSFVLLHESNQNQADGPFEGEAKLWGRVAASQKTQRSTLAEIKPVRYLTG